MATADVIIIGGGFAGVTAARELSMRGRTSILVEAKDRLGGRTYTADHDGHSMELGGTWIHPFQPNVWAEITRYGLELEIFPVPGGRQAVLSEGKMVELDEASVMQFVDALTQFCAPGTALFPAPYSDEFGTDIEQFDQRSMRDHLKTLNLSPVMRDMVDAMCSLVAFGDMNRSAATECMRVFAMSGSNTMHMLAALTAIKIKKGTRALIEAIAAQAKLTDIQLKSPVRRVVQSIDGVQVELTNGKTISAHTALVTLPMNVLNSVEFEPKLSKIKQIAATERHAGEGRKCYVRVKGDIGNVSLYAPESEAINWVVTYDHGSDGSWLNVYGTNSTRLPMDDKAAMQTALQRLLPGAEVEGIFGWDWENDPYALGTWCIFRPGQLTRMIPELRKTEGRLHFASGDSAIGWRSFIDGAIESGYHAAREIDHHLSS